MYKRHHLNTICCIPYYIWYITSHPQAHVVQMIAYIWNLIVCRGFLMSLSGLYLYN